MDSKPPRRRALLATAASLLLAIVIASCAATGPGDARVHRWWSGLGPVLPHDGFPAECSLCHVGDTWNQLRDDFTFDHAAETGVPLEGAHRAAQCLRCHNDRGPVQVFANQGCTGCHEDVHQGVLGPRCTDCHTQVTWQGIAQRGMHHTSRFPLLGAHANVTCHRCHPGGVRRQLPADRQQLPDLPSRRTRGDAESAPHPTRLDRPLRPLPPADPLGTGPAPLNLPPDPEKLVTGTGRSAPFPRLGR